MTTTILIEEQIEIPLSLQSLADFRAWATSDGFPEQGRIDHISGRIEVDVSPEDLYCHGALKVELIRVLSQRVKSDRLGDLFSNRARVSVPAADLSVEPDVIFVSNRSLDTERVRLVPKASAGPDRYVELEGAPDLVIEIVSDASVNKDTQRLPAAYFQAGVDEFWLIDARGDPLVFQIHRRGPAGFTPVAADAGGQRSAVFNRTYRLERTRNPQGRPAFDLWESE